MNGSLDVDREFTRLDSSKDQILRSLHFFKDSRDVSSKDIIFTQLNDFIESLHFLKAEIEFEHKVSVDGPIALHESPATEHILHYGELADFLSNIKKSIVAKQLEIKSSEISGFEEQKRLKFHIGESLEDADIVPELEKSRKDLQELENMSTDAKVMSTTKKITSKLTQSSQILQASLMQSQLNLEDLEIQDDELSRLADKYTFVGGLLEKSDEFVRDIKLSAERDRRIMKCSLLFFVMCVAWVWWSRVLRYPIKFLLYYPIMITFSIMRKLIGTSKEVDFISEEKFTSSIEMTSSIISSVTSDIVESVTTDIEEISTTLSQVLGTETTDELQEALGRIIDEL